MLLNYSKKAEQDSNERIHVHHELRFVCNCFFSLVMMWLVWWMLRESHYIYTFYCANDRSLRACGGVDNGLENVAHLFTDWTICHGTCYGSLVLGLKCY